ncbi:MAG: TIGR02757 family protein [Helicobacteraceae bacterium]|nr:TIGR02757 family protein [Helicobacteraceae bacterium]
MKRYLDAALAECRLDENNLDPLLIARDLPDDAALICALFAYGNVKAMIKFLRSLNFALLDASESAITRSLVDRRYRFQSAKDTQDIFIIFARMRKDRIVLERLFTDAYKKSGLLFALSSMIAAIRSYLRSPTRGVNFLLSKPFDYANPKGASALKRYLMFLRWMIRDSFPDLGRWRGVKISDLLIPLDTHSFAQASALGLLTRKNSDMLASIELTRRLKEFDPDDPVKYDFALYRMGQNATRAKPAI